MTGRRIIATGCDYALALLWATAVASVALLLIDPVQAAVSPVAGQALGLATITIPVVGALAWAEARGASPGKRLLGLRTAGPEGAQLVFGRVLSRTGLKVALPWELAHLGIWQASSGRGGVLAWAAIGAAYAVLGLSLAGLVWRGRPWYDAALGTTVLPAACQASRRRSSHA